MKMESWCTTDVRDFYDISIGPDLPRISDMGWKQEVGERGCNLQLVRLEKYSIQVLSNIEFGWWFQPI